MESFLLKGWFFVLCCHLLLFHFSSSTSLCHPHDSFALHHFKTSFPIDNHTYAFCDPADGRKISTWKNGTDCCSWLGVTCNSISGHVIGLDLPCSGLYGKMYPNNTLFRLSHLQSLNLAFNDFPNSQFSPLFGGFASLTHLNLSWSSFEGEIPSQISHLSKLQSLDLSYNNDQLKWKDSIWKRLLQNATLLKELILDDSDMSSTSMKWLNLSSSLVTLSLVNSRLMGKLTDDSLCLPNLQKLYLSSNYVLEGQLPNLSCSANSLTSLDLSENKLSGQIPDVFAGLTKLNSLNLIDNNLIGKIPSSLFDSTQLSVVDFSHNRLNGTIPSWCLSLPLLVYLDLSNNLFTGHISAISSNSLKSLLLCHNNLQGNIPESIFSLETLTELCLSSTNLSGSIHFPLFSKLQNLEYLVLSHNNQLSLNFKSNVNYSFPSLEYLYLSSTGLIEFSKSKVEVPRLKFLDLSNNKLSGRVPNWLHETSSLHYLDLSRLNLSYNKLSGHIPKSMKYLTNLESLDFSSNMLTGRIPIELVDLKFLEVVNFSHNLLVGEIPQAICNASLMLILNLSHNKLTSTVPQCLSNLSYLQVLDLQKNKLVGILPSFSKNEWLNSLNLNDNQFEGLLPESWTNCTNLNFLNLGNNKIEDTFPHWLQTLPYLKVLVLKANKLHGPITSLKAKNPFRNLFIFDISSNNFSGPIPKTYIKNFEAMKNVVQHENMRLHIITNGTYGDSVSVTMKAITMTLEKIPTNFVDIDLSINKFGEIPNVFGELHALKGLKLSHNKLSGRIPQSMGNLMNLESLDLSSNMLTGRIPTELANMNFLEVLNLSHNHLVGEIPQGKQFNTFSSDSYEGNLGCGVLLSVKCIKDPELHPPSSQTFWREDRFGFGWKAVAIGYGCGIVFGMGMGYCILLTGKPQWLVRMVGGQVH
ncbi:hypothetical protein Fmac_030568 [Flemingia macrophylla]|uniref:Leucine-rich repeat-containing N-terminal plant-type domain-containing protein n=1 Tax=Flemingia macrophylla TaxID=520843 RepID=A0ABD1KZJ1_9FABA